MRRAGLLLALATILASSATPAAAHHSPATCASSAADLTISSSQAMVRPGDPVMYTVLVSNQGDAACDVTATGLAVRLPAADGTATGTLVQIPLQDPPELPAGTPPTAVGTVPYTVAVNPGVTAITARVEGTGVLHMPVHDTVSVNKDLATPATQPKLGFTFGATPLSGFAPFTTTYEFTVSNTSTTNVPMDPPVIQHTSCPAVYASGDGNTIGQLDNGETWRYSCTRLFPTPQGISSTAVANARSRVDNLTVLAPASAPLTVTANRPPAATLELSRSADPRVGPAPLTVTHTYTLRNAGGADPRPVRNPTINDALCSPVARTSGGDDLLSRDETWTYTCTQTLATAGTVSGTAVASGVDDLGFNTVSSSNFAGIEVEATTGDSGPDPVPTASPTPQAGASPTPQPGATPTPTPRPGATPTPTPAPRPSTRVSLATTSGRFAPPCAKSATAQLKVGKRLIATKRIKLDNRCRYRVRFTNVTRSKLRGATRVSVTVRSGRRTATHRVSVPKT